MQSISNQSITFSEATIDNVAAVSEMMEKFYNENNYSFNLQIMRQNLTTFIEDDKLGKIWLPNIADTPAGYIILSYWFCFERQGKNAFIDELYVLPQYRRQGIGSMLLDFVTEQCSALNVKAIHLEVENENASATRLYNRKRFNVSKRFLMSKLQN